jgi:hypothetical protein
MIAHLEFPAVKTRRSFLQTSAALSLAASSLHMRAYAAPAEGWIELFDGKTLKGWHKNPEKIGHGTGGNWQVEDGAITGEQDPPDSGNGGILLTDRKFGDFELQLEMKPDFGPDSGLFLRSNDKGQCIQMMVDYHDNGNVGHLYGEGTGGWNTRAFDIYGKLDAAGKLAELTTTPDKSAEELGLVSTCTGAQWLKAWKINEWNKARVLCVGKYPKITTWINDLKVCEFDGVASALKGYNKDEVLKALSAEGSIAVQVHGGKGAWPAGMKCRWKNIRVKPVT